MYLNFVKQLVISKRERVSYIYINESSWWRHGVLQLYLVYGRPYNCTIVIN
jgi:hypothetical protein